MRRISFTGMVALVAVQSLIPALAAQAGEPEPIAPQTADTPAGGQAEALPAEPEVHLNLIDQKLALSLAVDTEAQIAMAEFALKGISDDSLRQLVTVRLEGQRNFAQQLEELTDGRTRVTIARARRQIENDRAPDNPRQKKFRLLSIRSATAMLARIRLEILQEYADLQRVAMATKSAREFDLHFLRCDTLNEMQVLATLKVFEGQASEDFAEVINRAWIRTRRHFDDALQILKQLETPPLAGAPPAQPVVVETAAETLAAP